MGRPRKQQPTFADALDVYLQTCTLDELEGVEMQVSVWKRVRLRLEKAPVPPLTWTAPSGTVYPAYPPSKNETQAALPLLKEQE